MTLHQDTHQTLIKMLNLHKSNQELALDFNTFQSPISHHFKRIGKLSRLDVLVSHARSEENKEDRIFIDTHTHILNIYLYVCVCVYRTENS